MIRPRTIFLILFLVGVGIFEYLNFSGFCYSERRYLKDQELIDAAVRHAIARLDRFPNHLTYSSAEEFHSVNQNCCRIYKEGHPSLPEGTWVRILGWYVAVVRVWYKVEENGPRNYYDSYVSLNACGQVLQFKGTLESIPPTKL